MTQTEWLLVAIAGLCALVGALFTTADAALQSFSKSRALRLAEEGRRGAARLVNITQDPAPSLNTILFVRLVLETLCVILVALVIFNHTTQTWERIVYPTLTMVVVSFVLLGVAPRTLGRQHSEAVALRASGPVSAATAVLGPIPQLMIWIGNGLTPGRGFSDGPFSSEAELRELVDIAEASDLIEDDERRMIHSVFDLGDTIAKEVMVPRTDMVYIEQSKTVRQAVSLALRSGFSRIPVIATDLDDVVGILYLKDAIRRMYDNPRAQVTEKVEALMRPPSYCPDSKPVDELLREMQLTRSHVVVVVDEFGGTAGLVTIEDILEEIVGEIVDEYDQEVAPSVEIGPNRYRVSARLDLEDLGELFGLRIDDDDVETVLGVMAKLLDKVPIPGSTVQWEGIELVAERGTGRRNAIQTVVASLIEDVEPVDLAVDAAAQLASESAQRQT